MAVLGTSVKRREDPALITGKGKYTDDLTLPGMTYAVILRSPYAHARIRSIDTSTALAAAGVVGVYTGQDIAESEHGGVVPVGWLLPDLKTPPHPILAVDTARYVGDGVAVVVGNDRNAALDAAQLVQIDYEPLDAVKDVKDATAEGAPQIYEDAPRNVAFDWELGDREKTDAAFASAAKTVELI